MGRLSHRAILDFFGRHSQNECRGNRLIRSTSWRRNGLAPARHLRRSFRIAQEGARFAIYKVYRRGKGKRADGEKFVVENFRLGE